MNSNHPHSISSPYYHCPGKEYQNSHDKDQQIHFPEFPKILPEDTFFDSFSDIKNYDFYDRMNW